MENKPSWSDHLARASHLLTGLLPWIDIASVKNAADADQAVTELRMTMWRLRGMRDGIELASACDGTSHTGPLITSVLRAHAACADAMKAIDPFVTFQLAPHWTPALPVPPKLLEARKRRAPGKPKKLNGSR